MLCMLEIGGGVELTFYGLWFVFFLSNDILYSSIESGL